MKDLLDDLSILTCVNKKDFDRLNSMALTSISHYIEESIRDREKELVIDVGLGQLKISNIEDSIHYRFIPSDSLQAVVRETYDTKKSKLKIKIEQALGSRLTNTYKDLF